MLTLQRPNSSSFSRLANILTHQLQVLIPVRGCKTNLHAHWCECVATHIRNLMPWCIAGREMKAEALVCYVGLLSRTDRLVCAN